jgi:hypothetical protein
MLEQAGELPHFSPPYVSILLFCTFGTFCLLFYKILATVGNSPTVFSRQKKKKLAGKRYEIVHV